VFVTEETVSENNRKRRIKRASLERGWHELGFLLISCPGPAYATVQETVNGTCLQLRYVSGVISARHIWPAKSILRTWNAAL